MNREEALRWLQAAGLDLLDADRALDDAVIARSGTVKRGGLWVKWTRSGGYAAGALSPADLSPGQLHAGAAHAVLAASGVPGALGFTPARSLVLVAQAPDLEPLLTLRYDLPAAGDASAAQALAAAVAGNLRERRVPVATVVSFGSVAEAGETAALAAGELTAAGLEVAAAVRVNRGRVWCLCGARPCAASWPLPAPGRGTAGSPVPAVPLLRGQRWAAAVGQAVQDAEHAARALPPGEADRRGCGAVRDAVARARSGSIPASPPAVAELAVALQRRPALNTAWELMQPVARAPAHQQLWAGLARRAPGLYRAGPAALLAFTAWQQGNRELVTAALDVALAASPRYGPARRLREILAAESPAPGTPGTGVPEVPVLN